MTSFFPDLNVWLALSDSGNSRAKGAWAWWQGLPSDCSLLFCRFTQLGLLRLLTNPSVMGDYAYTLQGGWAVYDRWLNDPRVQFHPEPRSLDAAFRHATIPFAHQRAPKWIGDCYLLAFAEQSGSTLVTFDRALATVARKHHRRVIIPSHPA